MLLFLHGNNLNWQKTSGNMNASPQQEMLDVLCTLYCTSVGWVIATKASKPDVRDRMTLIFSCKDTMKMRPTTDQQAGRELFLVGGTHRYFYEKMHPPPISCMFAPRIRRAQGTGTGRLWAGGEDIVR